MFFFSLRLVFRRAACYHKLNDPERSSEELKICRDLIKQTAGLDRKKIEAFCKEMDQLSQQTALLTEKKVHEKITDEDSSIPNVCSSPTKANPIEDDLRPPSPPSPPRASFLLEPSTEHLYKGVNKLVPCASASVRVIYSKDKGRHMIATEDIPPDAFILIERPYACLLLPKFVYTYCDYW